jgi:hypothetical protein
MGQASKRRPDSAEKTVRDIRRATRRHHSAEEREDRRRGRRCTTDHKRIVSPGHLLALMGVRFRG